MRIRTIVLQLGSVMVFAAPLVVALAVPATAAKGATARCSPNGSAAGKTISAGTVGYELAVLDEQGKSQSEVDAIMKNEWCLGHKYEWVNSRAASTTTLINRAGSDAVVVPNSNNHNIENSDDVEWLVGEVYYESGPSEVNFGEVKYSWVDHDFAVDASILTECPYNRAEGGQDGMAVAVSKGDWNTVSQSLEVYGDPALDPDSNDYTIQTIDGGANTAVSASWKWQDNTRYVKNPDCTEGFGHQYMDLDDYRGIMTWEFYNADGVCVSNVFIKGSYDHTWNSTGVTGVSISLGPGNNSIGFGWGVTGSSDFESDSPSTIASDDLC